MLDRRPTGVRARVVVIDDCCIALIRRERPNRPVYYVLPGGGVEDGETLEQAAVREAREELGLDVRIERLAAIVHWDVSEHHCFYATPIGGSLGTGLGPEFTSSLSDHRGVYEAVWLPLASIAEFDVWPAIVVSTLADEGFRDSSEVVCMTDTTAVG